MLKKLFRRLFKRKIKTTTGERFMKMYSEATKVNPGWVNRNKHKLTKIAEREDVLTDATIILYRDRRGNTIACDFQHGTKERHRK